MPRDVSESMWRDRMQARKMKEILEKRSKLPKKPGVILITGNPSGSSVILEFLKKFKTEEDETSKI